MATVALVITSDRVFRGEKKDEVTPLVQDLMSKAGHAITYREVVPNDVTAIRRAVEKAVSMADLVIVSGGTGPSPKDLSIEAVEPMASKKLPGFGELFRLRSFDEVGYGVILTRAEAYVVGSSLVVVTPGSPSAVRLAVQLVLPILGHALEQIRGAPHH